MNTFGVYTLCALGVLLLGSTDALGSIQTTLAGNPAGGVVTGSHMRLFLFQFIALFALGWGLGRVAKLLRAPKVVGEILAGILLGPSIFGHLVPGLQHALFPGDPIQRAMLETMALFGVLLLLLETGIEIDAGAAMRMKRQSLLIGGVGVVLPATLAAALAAGWGQLFPVEVAKGETLFYAFLGVAMSISAMVVIVRVLNDLNLVKTDLGVATLCGYTVNDVLAFVCFGLVMSLAVSGTIDYLPLGLTGAGALTAALIALTVGRRVVSTALMRLPGNGESRGILIATCLLGAVCGGITDIFGLTALFGFFLAGVACSGISDQTKHQFNNNIFRLVFVPVYFGWVGLQLDIVGNFSLPWVAFVLFVSLLVKYVGAWVGAFLARVPAAERHPLAVAFTPSGVIEIIISREALNVGLINETIFVAIVLSAVVSTLIVGPWLQQAINSLEMERSRELLRRDAVIPQLQAKTPVAAVEELCRHAQAIGLITDAQAVAKRVLVREEQMGTALGKGVAIPHARLPELSSPAIVFARSEGIDWKAADRTPVRFVFLLLAPDNEAAIRLQSMVAQIGLQERTLRALLAANDSTDMWRTIAATLRLKQRRG